jgi:glycosyltransferase involved in cell wall biosynthesis
MKVSIITVVFNNKDTIEQAINSVLEQDYQKIEYIVIDGKSTDGTVAKIEAYGDKIYKFISEKDRGIYDAMNKGLKLADGEVIGILNSDDFYPNNQIISQVVQEFEAKSTDLVFGDIVFVEPTNLNKIVRYYSSANFHPQKFAWGWMPAHPSCFLKREVYEKYGNFKTDYAIASDYEILTRFMAKYGISYSYIPEVLVKMRKGGVSNKTFLSNWILNKEIVRACAENGIKTNMLKVLSKYPTKIFQLVRKPK